MPMDWLGSVGKIVNGYRILEAYKKNGKTMIKAECPKCGRQYNVGYDAMSRKKPCICCNKNRMKDITGQRFGRLIALEPVGRSNNGGGVIWLCQCDCGNTTKAEQGKLAIGAVKSCGCLKNEAEKKQGDRLIQETMKTCVDGTNIKNLSSKVGKSNTSGIRGVSWNKRRKKWQAYIMFKKKMYHLGMYDKKEDAAKARKEAEDKYFNAFLDEYNKNMNNID
jgi:hypothetical protein